MTEVHKSVGSLEDEAIVSLNVSQDERAFLNFIDDVLFENGNVSSYKRFKLLYNYACT